MSRRRREPAAHDPLPAESRRDPLARWRRFVHRGTTIEFVLSNVIVKAPDALNGVIDVQIAERTRREPEN